MTETALTYKRETSHRIFVNRSLHLNKIKFFGFDMDYTLAQYKSPQFETMSYDLIVGKLIEMGYPEELKQHKYDPNFPVRGMWFDKVHGTLLKMDQFGNILVCLLGFSTVQGAKLREMYPNKFVKYNEDRIIIMNTLFDLPKLFALACITQVLTTLDDYVTVSEGVQSGNLYMSFTSIYEDVDKAMNWLHGVELKKRTVDNLDHYVEKDPNILVLLDRLRSNGAKTFLLTNSDYLYTDAIMTYITSGPEIINKDSEKQWTDYFDYIVTDAKKPSFFKNGTVLRLINKETGKAVIGHHIGPLVSGQIYSGGNCKVFSDLIGARGKDVLFVGDHIFGDIVKSKKTNGWRTFLIIPELINEIYVWKTKRSLFERLSKLDQNLAEIYKDMNINSSDGPDISNIKTEIRKVAHDMESAYGRLGSIFRNGSRHTFFSSQALRYADLYSFSCINLIYYPLFYMFRAPQMLMPHESTVSHEESPTDSINDFREIPYGIRRRSEKFILEHKDDISEADEDSE